MSTSRMQQMKLISRVEIAFWDTAIALMSRDHLPRVYSHTLAVLTLRLQPAAHQFCLKRPRAIINSTRIRWVRLALISAAGLLLGVLLGYLSSS